MTFLPDNKCYGIVPEEREDCGYFGIQREECEEDRGCCFDHTVPNVPWCFKGREPSELSAGPTETTESPVEPVEGTESPVVPTGGTESPPEPTEVTESPVETTESTESLTEP